MQTTEPPSTISASSDESDQLASWCLAAQHGDRAAESRLIGALYPTIEKFLTHYVHNPANRPDVLQDTFEIAVRQLRAGRPEDPTRVKGYVYGIARYVTLGKAREQAREGNDCTLAPDVDRLADAGDGPLETVLELELATQVRDAIKKLRQARDRALLRGYYLEERDSAELTREWNLKPAHFYRVLHRARQRAVNKLPTDALANG